MKGKRFELGRTDGHPWCKPLSISDGVASFRKFPNPISPLGNLQSVSSVLFLLVSRLPSAGSGVSFPPIPDIASYPLAPHVSTYPWRGFLFFPWLGVRDCLLGPKIVSRPVVPCWPFCASCRFFARRLFIFGHVRVLSRADGHFQKEQQSRIPNIHPAIVRLFPPPTLRN